MSRVSASACAAAFAVVTCTKSSGPTDEAGTTAALTGPAAAIVEETSNERRDAGLPPLRPEARLSRAAQLHAHQLASAGRLDHALTDARYPTLEDRLAASDYAWRAAGENLASGQPTAAQAVDTWMSSAPHRANILNTTFTETGAAVATDGSGRLYYVQVFGRP